jgi:histidinol dehydrogenase
MLWLGLIQLDIIPDAAWAQYPVVILFIGTFVVLARYHLAEQDKWRDILQRERADGQRALEGMLQEQRLSQVELLKLMQASSQEMFQAYSKAQVEAFEEALEKIAANYYGLVREQQTKGNR